MISWIPVLGRNGLINTALVDLGLIPAPIEWLLYSDFAVVLAMVHLYSLFMVVPIFNTMMRIDRSLVEAARDAGRVGLANSDQCHHSVGKTRHGHRYDFCRYPCHGRFHHGAGDVRWPERLGSLDDEKRDVPAAISRRPPPMPSFS